MPNGEVMPRGKTERPPMRTDVECEYEGKMYRGTYEVTRGMLTVSWVYGSESATPGSRPDVLAKLILRELIEDAKRRGLLKA